MGQKLYNHQTFRGLQTKFSVLLLPKLTIYNEKIASHSRTPLLHNGSKRTENLVWSPLKVW